MSVLEYFIQGFAAMTWQQYVMFAVGGLLIYLAIAKDYEPMLLLPIGFGAILVNLPLQVVWEHEGVSGALKILFDAGIMTELFPLLIYDKLRSKSAKFQKALYKNLNFCIFKKVDKKSLF